MAEDKKKKIAVAVINVTEEYLKEKLYEVRGKKVLLDADLAEIYGYTNNNFYNENTFTFDMDCVSYKQIVEVFQFIEKRVEEYK